MNHSVRYSAIARHIAAQYGRLNSQAASNHGAQRVRNSEPDAYAGGSFDELNQLQRVGSMRSPSVALGQRTCAQFRPSVSRLYAAARRNSDVWKKNSAAANTCRAGTPQMTTGAPKGDDSEGAAMVLSTSENRLSAQTKRSQTHLRDIESQAFCLHSTNKCESVRICSACCQSCRPRRSTTQAARPPAIGRWQPRTSKTLCIGYARS